VGKAHQQGLRQVARAATQVDDGFVRADIEPLQTSTQGRAQNIRFDPTVPFGGDAVEEIAFGIAFHYLSSPCGPRTILRRAARRTSGGTTASIKIIPGQPLIKDAPATNRAG